MAANRAACCRQLAALPGDVVSAVGESCIWSKGEGEQDPEKPLEYSLKIPRVCHMLCDPVTSGLAYYRIYQTA